MLNLVNTLYYEYLEAYGEKIHKDPDYKAEDERYARTLKRIESLLPDSEKSLVNIIDESNVRKTSMVEKNAIFYTIKTIIAFIIELFAK